MLQLVHIEYWAGRKKQTTVMLMINIDDAGQFVGLRSDKLFGPDIKKIQQSKDKLVNMDIGGLHKWLSKNLQGYGNALYKLKKGRYKVVESYKI